MSETPRCAEGSGSHVPELYLADPREAQRRPLPRLSDASSPTGDRGVGHADDVRRILGFGQSVIDRSPARSGTGEEGDLALPFAPDGVIAGTARQMLSAILPDRGKG